MGRHVRASFNRPPLTPELRRDCLSSLSPTGRAVPASRMFLGHEHACQVERIAKHLHLSAGLRTEFCKSLRQLRPANPTAVPCQSWCLRGTSPDAECPAASWG